LVKASFFIKKRKDDMGKNARNNTPTKSIKVINVNLWMGFKKGISKLKYGV
jgi:hypothetical protein